MRPTDDSAMREYSRQKKAERASLIEAERAEPQGTAPEGPFTFRTTDPVNVQRNGQSVEIVRKDGYSPGGMFVLVRFGDGEQFVATWDELTKPVDIPELEPHCGSWICTSPTGALREFFDRATVEQAATAGWRIETAAGYLGRLNREREAGKRVPAEKQRSDVPDDDRPQTENVT